MKLHHHLVAAIIITLPSLITKCNVNTNLKCVCNNVKLCFCISVVLLVFYILFDLCILFMSCFLCLAEHPEDKQLPVHPAFGHPSSVCHHPKLTSTGPGLLRHAHLL